MDYSKNGNKPTIVCIVGPTASGKTEVAVSLSGEIGGEVVSADSMQIYRGMDIGTSKPTPLETRGIAHHMIDEADIGERWSAARYAETAAPVINGIFGRGKTPVICGGTGLYIDALTKPLAFAGVDMDEALRRELEDISLESGGRERLHGMLREIDPVSAERLAVNDARRVIRAIEVYRATGMTKGERNAINNKRSVMFRSHIFGLRWDREALYKRIDARVDSMISRGLIGEVKRLVGGEFGAALTSGQALGYKEIASSLRGEYSIKDSIALIKQRTRNYAKRQMTWFRKDSRVKWIEATNRSAFDISKEIVKELRDYAD